MAAKQSKTEVQIKPLKMEKLTVDIENFEGSLVVHNWSEKAIREVLQKQMSTKKTKGRDKKDPDKDFHDSLYTFKKGKKTHYGFPATGFKKAIIRACKLLKDVGQIDLDMTMARQVIFVVPNGKEEKKVNVPLENNDVYETTITTDLVEIKGNPIKRMDLVRVQTSSDIRFRAEFPDWTATLTVLYNPEIIDANTLCNVINRAGMTVGIGDGRPEKTDQGWGKFTVVG